MNDRARIVSGDVGNGFTKFISSTNQFTFPSVIATEQGAIDFEGFSPNHDFVIEFDSEGNGSQRFAIGETAWKLGRMRVTAMDRSRIGTPFYKTLFAGGLAAVVQQPATLSVVLSLPVEWYSEREKVKDMMAGEYVVGFAGRTLSYQVPRDLMRVIPEGFGTVCTMVLDKSGQISNRSLADSRVGVVDVGTKTTDLMLFDALEIYPAMSGGINTALADAWKVVGEEISKNVGRNLEPHEVDDALHLGYFKHRGRRVDIKEWKTKALRALAAAVDGEIKSLWQGGDYVDNIIVTGGGAVFVFEYLDYPHKYIVPEGHFANVDGSYRYGLLRSQTDQAV